MSKTIAQEIFLEGGVMQVVGPKSVSERNNRSTKKMLTPEQEVTLVKNWQNNGDHIARQHLVEAFQPLVLRMASKIAKKGSRERYHELCSDLVSVANIALFKTADKFDPEKGFRFSTYARWWIQAAMFDFIIQDHSLVKGGMSGNQRTLFFNLPKVMAEIDRKNMLAGVRMSFEEKIQKAADTLGIPRDVVLEYSGRLVSGDLSLNSPMSSEDEESSEWIERLESDADSPEEALMRTDTTAHVARVIANALECLTERERDVLTRRRLDPEKSWTLQELADEYKISRERIRQIEVRAFEKMQRHIQASGVPVKTLIS
ncbi:sigma-70 family RNA polymerase sigma factor [Epibacterium sp. DP7N7-1]|nr:sigma-70 family RNA polymerase sigma factor [Epibacterium sp. DP7N7-1]